LEQVFKAVAEGELDTTLMAAKIERAKRLKPTITK
jgi:hypothetical protein